MIREFPRFVVRVFSLSFTGSWRYHGWMAGLTILVVVGGNAYVRQIVDGLAVTNLTDEVSWGLYIANFVFFVGVAAAAVMLVIPAYVLRNRPAHDIVLLGELLAIAAIVVSLLFVIVDLGRPERMWHLVPGVGMLNFPRSLLSWDVIVLGGYLLLNLYICGYLLYMKYQDRSPSRMVYIPVVFIAIVWAIGIHTVTAFLYAGLVGRPYWNSAIVAPRFLASAFVSGPALMILAFQAIRRVANFTIDDDAFHILRRIVTVSLLINLFFLGCEAYTEFYSDSLHAASARYVFFGLEHDGQHYRELVPWIRTAIALQALAALGLITPAGRRFFFLNVACAFAVVGVWIEKGMGLIVPGFVPTPLGNIVEYRPALSETLISMGVLAFGILMYSWMLHVAIPILKGSLSVSAPREGAVESGA